VTTNGETDPIGEMSPTTPVEDVELPESSTELFKLFIKKTTEARDASHRLANTVQRASLALYATEAELKKRRRRRAVLAVVTFLITIYASAVLLDEHVEKCAVAGRPSSERDERMCDLTNPFHNHHRTPLFDQPYFRHQLRELIREELDRVGSR
jgi:hypothetical protein